MGADRLLEEADPGSSGADAAGLSGAAAPAPSPDAEDAVLEAGTPPASAGAWLDGRIYRFRLEAIRRCTAPDSSGQPRIGAVVRVTSKIDELLVAPRDFKLESGGVILDSAILTKSPAGCAPLLAPKSLRAGRAVDGVVVFDLPSGFGAGGPPVRLAYQPTRWGGARRVEAVLPPGSIPSGS